MSYANQKGLSFAELLATTGIAALLLSVGLPGLSSFTKDARQVSAANDLLADLHFARDLAITTNSRVTICPSSNGISCNEIAWQSGHIVFMDMDGDRAVSRGDTVRRVAEDTGNVDISTAQFGKSITYRPNGRAMANAVNKSTGEFVICDDRGSDYSRTVIVDVSGRARVSHESSRGLVPACSLM